MVRAFKAPGSQPRGFEFFTNQWQKEEGKAAGRRRALKGQEEKRPETVLEVLRKLPDPRGRQGRYYPLASLVGLLLLAALTGQSSLKGIVEWIQLRLPVWMGR